MSRKYVEQKEEGVSPFGSTYLRDVLKQHIKSDKDDTHIQSNHLLTLRKCVC